MIVRAITQNLRPQTLLEAGLASVCAAADAVAGVAVSAPGKPPQKLARHPTSWPPTGSLFVRAAGWVGLRAPA